MASWYLKQLIVIQKSLKQIEEGFVDIDANDFPGNGQIK